METKTTLIIPALNEEGCIGEVINNVPDIIDEIIVVDGHSTDNTIAEASEALGNRGKVIKQTRKGFGAAIYDGVNEAHGDIIIVMDADGSQDPLDIPKLISKLSDSTIVMASRYAKGGKSDDDTLIRGLGNWIFTKLTNTIHGTKITDSLYFFFAISRNDFNKLNLQSLDYGICIEFLAKAKHAGMRFEEIPVIEHARLHGESKVNAFSDGLKILRVVLRRY